MRGGEEQGGESVVGSRVPEVLNEFGPALVKIGRATGIAGQLAERQVGVVVRGGELPPLAGDGKEGEQTSNVKATYTVKVYVDADGDMVIIQNPTLAPAIEKSDYEPKTPEADASVDADTVNDATAFLETFFKLYPTATEKELAYYVSGNVIEPIGRDYLYSELVNPIFTKDGDNVKVKVAVKFLDNQTKATQVSQYELVLHKDSNWKIVG